MRALVLLPALLLGSAVVVAAQETPAPARANALGVVFDSIRLRPLVGAHIVIDSSELFGVVDAEGRFRIDDIPAGSHYLRIEHALLDTLGLTLRTPAMMFSAGSTTVHELGIPAPERLIEMFCSAAWRARGPAALMGRVREADSGQPATGAKVSLVWYEMNLQTRLQRVPRVREAQVGPDGTYRICGLPAQLDGKVQVIRGPLTSGEIAINFGDDLLALRSMSIAAPGAVVALRPDSAAGPRAPAAVMGIAKLRGRVVNKTGKPLVGARVLVDGTTRATQTRLNGEFMLDSLPPGTQNVTVRLLGYMPAEQAVDLSSSEMKAVTLQMEDFVPTLEAVRVTAQRDRSLDDVGFLRRKKIQHGFYMEGEEIKARSSLYFSDLLRSAPGIRITQENGRQFVQSSRDPANGCVQIWVDGTMWQQMDPGDIDDFVKPFEVGAIEVYSPTNTPMEFQGPRGAACTTIVAWTNHRLERYQKKRQP